MYSRPTLAAVHFDVMSLHPSSAVVEANHFDWLGFYYETWQAPAFIRSLLRQQKDKEK